MRLKDDSVGEKRSKQREGDVRPDHNYDQQPQNPPQQPAQTVIFFPHRCTGVHAAPQRRTG
jgi:hypothetical protein